MKRATRTIGHCGPEPPVGNPCGRPGLSEIRALAAALVAVATTLFLSCGESGTDPVPPPAPVATTVSVAPTSAALAAIGETIQFMAEVRDQNGQPMAGAPVAWSSSDPSVAPVDAAGLVTAAANGTATITATSGFASGEAAVTVAQSVTAVAITPDTAVLLVGDTLRLSATAMDALGVEVEGADVSWSSGDTLVATVDSGGLATGIGAGAVEIKATSAGVEGVVRLVVAAAAPTTVVVTPDSVRMTAVGDTVRLSADVLDQIERPMRGVAVAWSSGDSAVASVDSAGLVQAHGAGSATVTASSGSASGTALVTVIQSASSVVVTPAEADIGTGDTLRLVAEAFDANGNAVAGAAFSWSSSDASVASVDATGVVRGVGEGRTTITAAAAHARGTSEVTVTSPDRGALVALYNATDGPNWVNNANWLSDAPLGDWYGVQTDGTGRVVRVHIPDNLLAGPIPSDVSKLTKLQHLSLGNNGISGQVPAALTSLPNLRTVDLNHNVLEGPIPPELGDVSTLFWLDFNTNSLTGPIPRELAKLSDLGGLDLNRNRLTGEIPAELGGLGKLQMLRLGRNTLSGPIPSELGNLSELTRLDLRDNHLGGAVPQSFLGLERLERLDATGNPDLCTPGTSAFQTWLRGIDKRGAPYCSESDRAMLVLLYEDAGGSGWTNSDGWLDSPLLTGWHGVGTDSLGRVVSLDLARNALAGRLPAGLGELAHMTELQVDGNSRLAGRLPVTLSRLALRTLHYGGTGLCVPTGEAFRGWLNAVPFHEGTGTECVPLSDREILSALFRATDGPNWRNNGGWLTDAPLGDWHGVEVDGQGRVVRLELPFGDLSGSIPPELGDLASLASLDLRNNALSGSIPAELGNLARLAHLDFRFNGLSGPIPPELGGLVALERLELRHNSLSGPIPPELGELLRLDVLFLEFNSLTGPIPPELGRLESLRVLSLGGNGISGSIPPTFANLDNLTHLYLGRNHLTGRIPPAIGSLPRLTFLTLDGNDLTGPIPSEVGALANLSELILSDNRLTGAIPPEVSRLSRLARLDLAYNGLTGSIPPALGDLSALSHLFLGHNRLHGSVPPELARLTGLRELSLVGNARLSGALPADVTSLYRLDVLLAGGTGLCVPSDPNFTAWLDGVEQHHIARCEDEPTMAYLVQAVQSRRFPVPLVAGREALLRVFVTATQPTGTGIPPVRARFYRGGGETHVVDILGKSTPIPTTVDEADLQASANAGIPGEVVQPGLEMVVEVDPEGTLDPSLGVRKRIPQAGRISLDVRTMPTFNLTVVPLLWRESPDSSVLARTRGMDTDDEIFRHTRAILPVGDFDMAVHEPVVVTANRPDPVIRELEVIRTLEGGKGHYLGVMTGETEGLGGGAGGTTRITYLKIDGGSASTLSAVQAHEFGHNMSLMHTVPSQCCVDPSYPYSNGSIGAYGYDFAGAGSLVSPYTPDVMGRVNPSAWISDYHFTKALRFRLRDEGVAAATATPVKSLLLWGGTDAEGAPLLEPAFVTDAPPLLPPPGRGAHRLTGWAADGRELFSLSFDMAEIPHGDGGTYFALALPVESSWAGKLAYITLTGPGGSATLDGNTDRPMAILRDRRSGQVRGILRDPAIAVSADGAVAAHVASLAGPHIEALVSRGLPATRE